MEKFISTIIVRAVIMPLLLSSPPYHVAAMMWCGTCGTTPVPFPLSTGAECGDPWYSIRCIAGTLWLDALNSSSYAITHIYPYTQRIIIRPPGLAPNTCISTDFHSQGIKLDDNLPFNITSSNTVLMSNCTDALLNLQAPIDCSSNGPCHSYVGDNADAAACLRAPLCCSFRIGGSHTSYIIRIHDGVCAAYLSFVNFEGVSSNTVGMKKWPEPGVELEWILPSEPICKNQVDCIDLLNSKCLTDPNNVGQRRCFCNRGFKWDNINGLCQNANCKSAKGCKNGKIVVIAVVGGLLVLVGIIGVVGYNRRRRSKRKALMVLMKKHEQILYSKSSGKSGRIFC